MAQLAALVNRGTSKSDESLDSCVLCMMKPDRGESTTAQLNREKKKIDWNAQMRIDHLLTSLQYLVQSERKGGRSKRVEQRAQQHRGIMVMRVQQNNEIL